MFWHNNGDVGGLSSAPKANTKTKNIANSSAESSGFSSSVLAKSEKTATQAQNSKPSSRGLLASLGSSLSGFFGLKPFGKSFKSSFNAFFAVFNILFMFLSLLTGASLLSPEIKQRSLQLAEEAKLLAQKTVDSAVDSAKKTAEAVQETAKTATDIAQAGAQKLADAVVKPLSVQAGSCPSGFKLKSQYLAEIGMDAAYLPGYSDQIEGAFKYRNDTLCVAKKSDLGGCPSYAGIKYVAPDDLCHVFIDSGGGGCPANYSPKDLILSAAQGDLGTGISTFPDGKKVANSAMCIRFNDCSVDYPNGPITKGNLCNYWKEWKSMPTSCPGGQTGIPPSCSCPSGTIWNGSSCVPNSTGGGGGGGNNNCSTTVCGENAELNPGDPNCGCVCKQGYEYAGGTCRQKPPENAGCAVGSVWIPNGTYELKQFTDILWGGATFIPMGICTQWG